LEAGAGRELILSGLHIEEKVLSEIIELIRSYDMTKEIHVIIMSKNLVKH
jgi:hypothetical protein